MRRVGLVAASVAVVGLIAACGDDGASTASEADDDRPTVVATTSILGDVVENVAGDQVDVITIMPVGADPHAFQASAQQANEMREADALIVNGADMEEGLVDVIDAASDDGTPTFEAISAVAALDAGAHSHGDEEDDEGHDDHDHDDGAHDHDDEGHDHEGTDPHFFTDPARMAVSVAAMADFLVDNVDGIDADALRNATDDYIAELEALDAESESMLADIPDEQRTLVTNHESLAYFADRYRFEIVGVVVPGGSTTDAASAGEIAELAEVVEEEGVRAIFADTSSSDQLAQTLADEVGDVAVVELYTESLGDADSDAATYVAMIRTNVERVADALS